MIKRTEREVRLIEDIEGHIGISKSQQDSKLGLNYEASSSDDDEETGFLTEDRSPVKPHLK